MGTRNHNDSDGNLPELWGQLEWPSEDDENNEGDDGDDAHALEEMLACFAELDYVLPESDVWFEYDVWYENGSSKFDGETERRVRVMPDTRADFFRHVPNENEIQTISLRDWKLRKILEAMRERRDDFDRDFRTGGEFTSLLVSRALQLEIVRPTEFGAVSSLEELLFAVVHVLRERARAFRNSCDKRTPTSEIWRECNEFVCECHLLALHHDDHHRIHAIEKWAREVDSSERPRLACARKWRARVARLALEMRVDKRIGKHAKPSLATWLSHANQKKISTFDMDRVGDFLRGFSEWGNLANEFEEEWRRVNGTPASVQALSPAPSATEDEVEWFVNNT
jgi:hypothetical protein